MSKPIIAVLCTVAKSEALVEYKLSRAYTDAITSSGGVPVILPYTQDKSEIHSYADLCDGFLFTGGNDINPAFYGEDISDFCGETEDLRDEFELTVAKTAISSQKPIMGICRGAQLLNVALGGNLFQDIPHEIIGAIAHTQSEPKNAPSHCVAITDGTPLHRLIGTAKMTANSFHHQAIKVLGNGLRAMAYAIDGVIEAVYSVNHPYLYAYQWHPERLFASDSDNRMLFCDFISACQKTKKGS